MNEKQWFESAHAAPPGERRGSRRVPTTLPVRFCSEHLEFEGEAALDAEICDVSEGGVFIRSDYLEPPGTRVLLLVSLLRERKLVSGRVAWTAHEPPKGPGMGIRLEHVPAAWPASAVR
jgi:hypothetical protein